LKCYPEGTGNDALAIYRENHIGYILLDIGLPQMSGFDLICGVIILVNFFS